MHGHVSSDLNLKVGESSWMAEQVKVLAVEAPWGRKESGPCSASVSSHLRTQAAVAALRTSCLHTHGHK